ncbi:MAG: riboflavin synthase [Cyanobacteria bacterium]|nr:riboflavin synthase [Cyanobacteriota bacterium]
MLHITCVDDHADLILADLAIGDSVAVDGICLTVTTVLPQGFIATASPETLYRTTLGELRQQSRVNLETSLRVGSKLGGHFVTGHVDGVGQVEAIVQTATSWEMSFVVTDGQISRYIVPKGSIAVNGVSLTVAACNQEGSWFKVAVIPHSYASTNLQFLKVGSRVNLEGDILGKYVEKFLRIVPPTDTALDSYDGHPVDISLSFLAEHGYV